MSCDGLELGYLSDELGGLSAHIFEGRVEDGRLSAVFFETSLKFLRKRGREIRV